MVKQGYKPTEIGVIPEGWEVKELGELGVIGSSKRIFESDYVDYGVPFYRGKEISLLMENKSIDEPYYISEEKFVSLSSKYGAPQKNDLLITAVGTLGNIYHVNDNQKFYFKDGNLIWIRKIEGNSKFIKIALDYHKNQILENAIGSSQKALTIKSLSITQIPLPPLAEQEAIASALSDADAWIERLEQLIAKKRGIKQGTMQTLLTPQENWEVKKLGEVCDEGYQGINTAADKIKYQERGIPILQAKHITKGYIDFEGTKNISKEDFINYKDKYMPTKGEILFTNIGTIGKTVLVDDEVNFLIAWNIFKIKLKDNFSGKFLLQIFKDFDEKGVYDKMLTGNATKFINRPQLFNLNIAFPSHSEQERIATILSDMDAELEALDTQLGKARQIKQGMMQELLTGRVRLV